MCCLARYLGVKRKDDNIKMDCNPYVALGVDRTQDSVQWPHLVSALMNYQVPQKNKQTPWPLVRERTIPTERPPLVDEI
jgi:hypothetical protein